ncbi:MAG: alpha/beta hydrolase [Rhodobacteraceae bacterium]|nr:alpha/beta hydrolase [Paracoccaceae bacterium]
MPTIDYQQEYDNRAAVPEHPEIFAAWRRDAEAARAALSGERDVAYGPRPRQVYDHFASGAGNAPVMMFIHGGYWRSLDKSAFSHLAHGPVAHGIDVYVPSYTLCPEVGVGDIIEEMRQAAVAIHQRAGRRVVVAGHSAGGHLAACLLATDWTARDPGLPADLVPAAFSLSGLFDLEPLRHTKVNDALGLDAAGAEAVSPMRWRPPVGKTADLVVGGAESGEYHRQSAELAQQWGRAGVAVSYQSAPSDNHFTVIAPLADASSAMTARIETLCGKG